MSAPLHPLFGLPRDSLDSRPHGRLSGLPRDSLDSRPYGRLSGQAPGADGVLAATHKLVQQAMTGQWQEVPKTVAERRVLLERVAATAGAQDQPWLNALRQAMAESDRAVASMAAADGTKAAASLSRGIPSPVALTDDCPVSRGIPLTVALTGDCPVETAEADNASAVVDGMMELLKSRP